MKKPLLHRVRDALLDKDNHSEDELVSLGEELDDWLASVPDFSNEARVLKYVRDIGKYPVSRQEQALIMLHEATQEE